MRVSLLLFAVSLSWLTSSAAFAGAWTLPKGRLWLKSAIYYQSTKSRFCTEQDARSLSFQEAGCTSAGRSAPFDPFVRGESEALAIFTEAVYGATGWLDLGIQVPFYSLQFTNLANPGRPRTTTLGDLRFFAKVRLLEKPFLSSITLGAKSPTGDFNVDAEVVNVSEGQWDFEVLGEIGKSFWPVRGYVSLGVGYRFRNDNDNFEHTMGNEFIALLEAGYNVTDKIMLKGSLDWLRGSRPQLKSTGDKLLWHRELMTIAPALVYSIGENLQLESSIRFSIRGRDFPDGPQFIGAVSYDFSLLD